MGFGQHPVVDSTFGVPLLTICCHSVVCVGKRRQTL